MDERVRLALARVFPDSAGVSVRPDSPLAALGPVDDAWPLLAAALEELQLNAPDDTRARSIITVGDLASAVSGRSG